MADELSAFSEVASEGEIKHQAYGERELLVLSQGPLLLGLFPSSVDSIVPWTEPTEIPEAATAVLGVVQDRGRLVAVAKPLQGTSAPRRLVICNSSLGLVGIPAESTRSVGNVVFRGPFVPGQPVLTDDGPLTVVDPEELAQRMVGRGGE